MAERLTLERRTRIERALIFALHCNSPVVRDLAGMVRELLAEIDALNAELERARRSER